MGMGNQDVADVVWPRIKKGMPLKQVAEDLLKACCARAGPTGKAVEPGQDNESVILVKLPSEDDVKGASNGHSGQGLAAGRRGLISKLESEAGRVYNGSEGIIESAGEAAERYDVRLVNSGEVKSFKAANLTL